jgi:hypothetical protein
MTEEYQLLIDAVKREQKHGRTVRSFCGGSEYRPFIGLKNGNEHVFVEFLSTGRTNTNFGPETVARLFERLHENGGSIHLNRARTHPAQLAVIVELHPHLLLSDKRLFHDDMGLIQILKTMADLLDELLSDISDLGRVLSDIKEQQGKLNEQ